MTALLLATVPEFKSIDILAMGQRYLFLSL
jgi:hypothetical protein